MQYTYAPLLVWWAQVEGGANGAAPGTVVGVDHGVLVQTGAGRLRLLRVQAANDDERPAGEWARRAGVAKGMMLA